MRVEAGCEARIPNLTDCLPHRTCCLVSPILRGLRAGYLGEANALHWHSKVCILHLSFTECRAGCEGCESAEEPGGAGDC